MLVKSDPIAVIQLGYNVLSVTFATTISFLWSPGRHL